MDYPVVADVAWYIISQHLLVGTFRRPEPSLICQELFLVWFRLTEILPMLVPDLQLWYHVTAFHFEYPVDIAPHILKFIVLKLLSLNWYFPLENL